MVTSFGCVGNRSLGLRGIGPSLTRAGVAKHGKESEWKALCVLTQGGAAPLALWLCSLLERNLRGTWERRPDLGGGDETCCHGLVHPKAAWNETLGRPGSTEPVAGQDVDGGSKP